MTEEVFIQSLFNKLHDAGIEEYEIYFILSSKDSIKVFEGNVDSYSSSSTKGISLRIKVGNKMGYSYTESLTSQDIELLIDEATSNASIIESTSIEPMYDGEEKYLTLNTYSDSLDNISTDEKIVFLKKVEKTALEFDPKIKKVNYCLFGGGEGKRIIKNSKGVDLSDNSNSIYTYISVIASENNIIKTGSAFEIGRDFSKFDPISLGEKAAKEALEKLEIIDFSSGSYPVVIKNTAFGDILSSFCGIFSAENVQKGLSKLKDRLNDKIATSKLTLVDDPHLKDGLASSSFDAEGVATKYKEVIKDGILKTYLYNLKTANIDNTKSTGNASKGGYKGTIGISPSNFYIKPGKNSIDDLFEGIEEGIYITSFAGLHSGINSISGDFSLAAEGFLIKEGKKVGALNQFTVASNFFDLLFKIDKIGTDLDFGLSSIGSPSILIDNLQITID